MQTFTALSFCASQCQLAEGPMWHKQRKTYLWVDIDGYGFYECASPGVKPVFFNTPDKVSLIVEYDYDIVLLAIKGGLIKYDLRSGKYDWLVDLDKQIINNRCNDGACDSKGRLWIGTMDMKFKPGAGTLYCIDEHLLSKKMLPNTTISNGLVWSLDNKKLYYIDTPTQKVQSFIFDELSGNIHFEKDVIHIPKEKGSPDGMAIDEEGMLWIAQWGGFGVYRWNPITGEQIGFIQLPVPNVSSCAFVGKSLDQLLITTARQDLSPDDLKKYPQSGDVFIASPGVKGVRLFTCKLGKT
ncbi:MAG: SMP-30/gluconolactonase/LRE family protein [Bacteroidetes bacterium]|nr:SMP-30/gluconolactonase/LRE family protein [Bacteroidota bacterium]